MKIFLLCLLISLNLFAEVRLLPDGGKNTRVINVPLEAEALFADKLAAPYGKSFESWVSSKNFSKDNQYPAGGYKIWSDSGEYLPKGEVIYRWPTEELPSKGMLEIFGDDHVHIELIHEGKHLTAGVGSVVINLESLPPFYDVLILRFSSQKPHRALVWAQHYLSYESVQKGSCSHSELSINLWQPADSLAFMNLNSDRYFWVKRNYQVADNAEQWILNFSNDIEEFYLNGIQISYPQLLSSGQLKTGINEVIFKTKNWLPGANSDRIYFSKLKKNDNLNWYKLDGSKWAFRSSFYEGSESNGGQNLLFSGHELKSVNLKTRFNLSKKDLSKKYALVFNMLGGVSNASLKGLIPPFIKLNDNHLICGKDGVELIGLKEGQNEITIRASGKILAPSLLCEDVETYELKGKSVALDYYLNGSELKIDLISNGVHTDLYVEKDHLFSGKLEKDRLKSFTYKIKNEYSLNIGIPGVVEKLVKLRDKSQPIHKLDLNDISIDDNFLSEILGVDYGEGFSELQALRQSKDPLNVYTIMPSGQPLFIYLLPQIRDSLILGKFEGKDITLSFPSKPKIKQSPDIFESRAYQMWSDSADDKNLEKFRELRFSYVYDLCKSLLNEFGAKLE